MKRLTLTILLATAIVFFRLFVFAACRALTLTTINGTCPSSCLCAIKDSSLHVGNCTLENVDQEQLSEQINSLLSSNLTYRYLTHGQLWHLGIISTPLMHVPRSVCRLATLQALTLYENPLIRLPDNCFINLTTLTTLYAVFNHITKLQDGVFDGLYNLGDLYLNNNSITELRNEIFGGLRKLKYLHLEFNRISSIGLHAFDGLSKLEILNLNSNITELQNGIFDKLRMLVTLTLNNNRISSIGSRVFDGLSKLTGLYLRANHITQLHGGIFDGLYMLKSLDVSNNRISSIGSRVFSGFAMKNSQRYINLSHNRIQTLDSWPIYTGINQIVKIDLSDNNIHRFTNMMRWKENCGMRKVRFDLLLERNPIKVSIADLLRGWDMNISSIWRSSPQIEPYSLTTNFFYFDCDCVDFTMFSFQLSVNAYYMPVGKAKYNNLSLILNQDNTVPLDQFICELTERCPSGCRCVHRPANATLHIHCSNTNLTVLPLQLPELPKSYTKYILDFSNNRLRRLEHRDYFVNTSILNVRNSRIEQVESADVWKDILKILQVNLYGNKLTSIPQSII